MTSTTRLIVAAGVLSLGLVACKKGGDASQQGPGGAMPPAEVGVVEVRPQSLPVSKDLVGRLAPFRSADVRARVTGVVQKRLYEEGADVHEGQVLFVIDPSELRAATSQSQAAVAQAEATYTTARATAERARRLGPTQYISKADLDNALAAERSAAAAVQQARAALASSRINLGYSEVRSPISGRAGRAQVTEGALVGQGGATLLATVDQIDPLYANFSISVAELDQLRRGEGKGEPADRDVQIVLPDGTVYAQRGTLDFEGSVVDPATGAVSLRARVPNTERRLLPGTYVGVRATLGLQNAVYLVPQAGVLRDAQGAYVYVVGADNKVVRKDVGADTQQNGKWVVDHGLAPGDRVIVSGIQRAQPGAQVKATPWTEGPADAKPAAAAPTARKG
ncbi:efflux RND transporter periplasmic adaptor subunit [Lysobacter sp. TY2-98]|uniref:efflux RND transporter periplasmic adaptor subunit n=1 Tax=Lysobacter sp. TY2-98 TaxID=2290922 RepID=UPI000E204B93|nr:efflux RND transporter periplasmic adaptor subunit [Lysobacter sp. TY2-98]AXK72709.1 efflux RND transporter periplasmic adaptor subunit [Lysobacter sp. TY2-98]